MRFIAGCFSLMKIIRFFVSENTIGMSVKFTSILLLISCLFYCCKPYDTNEANKQLVQGKWMLVDLKRAGIPDSLSVDFNDQKTILIFKDSLFTQQLVDLDQVENYQFRINNYRLGLFENSLLVQELSIDKLTKDSLILTQKADSSIWKYKKIE